MNTTTIQLTQADIERLPNYKKRTANEWSAACPFCGQGEDRFRFWPGEGNFWCRVCDTRGFVSDTSTLAFDRESWLRWQEQENERKRQEALKKLSTLEWLRQSGRAEMYHYQMIDRSWWYGKGLDDATINRFRFGFSPQCPTCPGSASYTIPISYQGELYSIRHRLDKPDKGGKYRPELAGLPSVIFNADALKSDDWMTVLVEGEIKAAVLTRYGFSAVGIPGANNFKDKWVRLFSDSQIVYVALDPGAEEQALKIAQAIKVNTQVRLCSFPVKPDDFFTLYKGTPKEFMHFLRLGEKL
jgi:hypothetical protein